MTVAGCGLLFAGCSSGDASPTSAPTGDVDRADLMLDITDFPTHLTEPGSGESFEVTVALQNVGESTWSWPDPCPTVQWDWNESATSFGTGYLRLHCDGRDPVPVNGCEYFDLTVPSAESSGALRFIISLVDPQGVTGGGGALIVASDDQEAVDWGTSSCDEEPS